MKESITMCLGIPGRVVETYSEHDILMGKVDFGGVYKRVCLEHTPDVKTGQFVIVHVGFALQVIDEQEAHAVFEFLERMNELDELREEDESGASSQGPVASSRWSPPGHRLNPQSAIRNPQ